MITLFTSLLNPRGAAFAAARPSAMIVFPRISQQQSSFKFQARTFTNNTSDFLIRSQYAFIYGVIAGAVLWSWMDSEKEDKQEIDDSQSNYLKLVEANHIKYDFFRIGTYKVHSLYESHFQFDRLSVTEFDNLCKFMIEHKTGFDFTDRIGQTALFYSIKTNNELQINQLLSNGANKKCFKFVNFNKLNTVEFTRLVRVMLDHQFDLELKDGMGRTVLFYSVELGSSDLIEELLEKGASPRCKNNFGETLWHIANRNFEKVTETLRRVIPELIDEEDDLHRTPIGNRIYFKPDQISQLKTLGASLSDKNGHTYLEKAESLLDNVDHEANWKQIKEVIDVLKS